MGIICLLSPVELTDLPNSGRGVGVNAFYPSGSASPALVSSLVELLWKNNFEENKQKFFFQGLTLKISLVSEKKRIMQIFKQAPIFVDGGPDRFSSLSSSHK